MSFNITAEITPIKEILIHIFQILKSILKTQILQQLCRKTVQMLDPQAL